MTGNVKVQHDVPPESLTRLKPQKLGRHYHKIPQFIKELAAKHPRSVSDYFLGNYRINLEFHKAEVHEEREQEAECLYQSTFGRVGFAIDRSLLTEVLECYYGGSSLPGQTVSGAAEAPDPDRAAWPRPPGRRATLNDASASNGCRNDKRFQRRSRQSTLLAFHENSLCDYCL